MNVLQPDSHPTSPVVLGVGGLLEPKNSPNPDNYENVYEFSFQTIFPCHCGPIIKISMMALQVRISEFAR
jgi:hypothetical protein